MFFFSEIWHLILVDKLWHVWLKYLYRVESGWISNSFVIFWPLTQPKNAIPRWCTGRKWHIPMASNRKRSRGRIKAYNMSYGATTVMHRKRVTVISAWWRLNIRFQRSSGRSCGRWIIIWLSWVGCQSSCQ